MKSAMRLAIVLLAILTLSGAVSENAYAKQRKPHHGKFSHYKLGGHADMFGKHQTPKKQKLPKHSYKAH